MKKQILLLALTLTAFSLSAQFPGGGGGGDRQGTRGNYGNGGWGQQNNPQQAKQTKGMAKISGIVLDSVSNKGVEYANIALFDQTTNKLIDGNIADEKGKFSIEGLADGTYRIQVSFLGYNNKLVRDIKIVKERNVSLPIIHLGESVNTLNEVTVTGMKALIEEKVDRLIYNAEKDQLAKGGDAADVLRKVPLLQVDLDGNVTVRGSSSIKVLINNKPSTIIASSIADALKQIPADMIKTVEVITSPSARYDAEGAAGIINIITKKDKMQGYNLNMDIGAGLRGSNLGLNGSFRSGKFGMTLGGHGRAFYNDAETNFTQNTKLGTPTETRQSAYASDLGMHGRYNLGMDYDIDKTQTITGNVSYGLRNFSRDQEQKTDIYQNSAFAKTALRSIENKDLSNNVDVNLDYLRTFKPQQEWSIASQYSRNNLTNNFISDSLRSEGQNEILNSLKNLNENVNQEITVQTDFQTPLSNNQMWEIGAKGIFRIVNSDFQYLSANGSTADYTLDPTRRAGVLNYGQNIAAAYTTYSISTKNKITVKAGLRYERTTIEAEQNSQAIVIPSYQNFVPSLNISKSLGGMTTVKAGYNRRIQRPGLQQLNPNRNEINPQNATQGNPSLEPELSDNLELGISTMLKKTYVNLSVFSRYTDNAINQVRVPDAKEGVVLTTFQNIGKQQSYGSNLHTNIYLTNTWSISGGLDVFYTFLQGEVTGLDGKSVTQKNQGWNFGGRLMSQLQLKNGWGVQAFSFLRGQQVELQGNRGGFGMYSIGGRKEFKNKKGSLGISFENFAARGWNVRNELNTVQFDQISNNLLLNRNIKINLSYKFGKLTFVDSRKKTRSIRNDDVKDGGGEGMGGSGNEGGGIQAQNQGGQGRAQSGGGSRPQGLTPQKGQMPTDSTKMKQGSWQGGRPQNGQEAPKQKPNNQPNENAPKQEGEGKARPQKNGE